MPVTKRGDTIIEVIIAITVFCLVSIISITLMNNGIGAAEGALETIMARNEIDAQAEALRFIQNSYLAERELPADQQQYAKLWRRITRDSNGNGLAIDATEEGGIPKFDVETCDEAYADSKFHRAFILNTRLIEPFNSGKGNEYDTLRLDDIVIPASLITPDSGLSIFTPAPLSPRILFSRTSFSSGSTSDNLIEQEEGTDGDALFRMVARVEGIWILAVRGVVDTKGGKTEPEFFDFYIRTCWYEPGQNFPSIIGTIVRLYNPEVIE